MRPVEGIDKINLLLNPLLLNKENKKKNIDPYNRLVLCRSYGNTILIIKQEYLNPCIDFQIQITLAIYELIKQGIINFPDTLLTPLFIYKFHQFFFHNITALEFYTSWKEDDIKVNEDMSKTNLDEAKENDCLYQYVNKDGKITETYYSNDKSRTKYDRSSFIIYNKQELDLKDNQIPKDVIYEFGKPIRTEFRLYADNTPWLHWDNLRGNYQEIFNRHKMLMATIYNNHVRECITVTNKENKNFNKVMKAAKDEEPIRYTGKELKKKQPIIKNDTQETVNKKFNEFGLKNKNMENGKIMGEMMEELKKNMGRYYKNK